MKWPSLMSTPVLPIYLKIKMEQIKNTDKEQKSKELIHELFKDETEKEMILNLCQKCNQMTNHNENKECLKCLQKNENSQTKAKGKQ